MPHPTAKPQPSKLVLVVEDEEPQRRALASKLMAAGLRVEEAANGAKALAKARALHPDLIILDIILPRLDGIGVLRELRKDTWGANADVIALTNLSEGVQSAAVRSLHVSEYLLKTDWRLEDVVKKAQQHLQH